MLFVLVTPNILWLPSGKLEKLTGGMMVHSIQKRSGSVEEFTLDRVELGLRKAFAAAGMPYDNSILLQIEDSLSDYETISAKELSDCIELSLFEAGHFKVAREFIAYQVNRQLQEASGFEKATYINCNSTIEEYINGTDWRISANSNTSYSNAGLINNSAGKVIANYWLDKVYSPEEGEAHRNGDFHIHDLDCLTGYCAGWSLRDLLTEGFNGVRGRVASSPPRHLQSALGQMANFLGILQSEWAGAQAFSSFDTYLAPYVFKDNLKFEEVRRAVKSFVYNLNVPARWGQSPFTNITIDWTVPRDLIDKVPMCGQEHLFAGVEDINFIDRCRSRGAESPLTMCYRHFQAEMNLINRAFYEVMTEGDENGQPFTFPIPTVNITEDFDWYGENTDLLFANTAKIGSSYFQNFIGSQFKLDENGNRVPDPDSYKPDAVRSMCCRLQLDLRELLKRGGGLFGSAEMTGSIGVVTINLARLGYRFCGDKYGLIKELEYLMDLARSTLEKKRVFVQQMYDRGLYPYTARYLPGFKNHFSTIGINGMHEMLRNFSGDSLNIVSKEGRALASEILDMMRSRIQSYQEETGNLYNLEATPAEGTTYRFAKEDRKRFPDIMQAGFGENIYYTNSSQLPVNFTDDPFEALEQQDELQCKYTGGTVLHLYMSEQLESAESCRRLVRQVVTNFRLPYITVTPLFSVCERHGYLNGEHEYCPHCDDDIITRSFQSDLSMS